MVDKILKAIEDTYHKKYVGRIILTKLPFGFKVDLGLNDSKDILISSSAQIPNEDDFIKYFILDLRERSLHHSLFFTEVRTESDNPGLYYRTEPKILSNE